MMILQRQVHQNMQHQLEKSVRSAAFSAGAVSNNLIFLPEKASFEMKLYRRKQCNPACFATALKLNLDHLLSCFNARSAGLLVSRSSSTIVSMWH